MKKKTGEKKKIENLGEEYQGSPPLEKIAEAKTTKTGEVTFPELKTVPPEEKQTLKEFIDDHQKLLSIVGFFAAFGVVWNQLVNTTPLNYISYFCFLATASLMFETFKGFKNLKDTPNTFFFKIIFYGIFVALVMNLIFAFPENFQNVVVNNLYVIIAVLIIYAGEKFITRIRQSRYEDYQKQFSSLSKIKDVKQRSMENKTINLKYQKQDFWFDLILPTILMAALIVSMIIYFYLSK